MCHEFGDDKKPLKLFRVVGLGFFSVLIEIILIKKSRIYSKTASWYKDVQFPPLYSKIKCSLFLGRKTKSRPVPKPWKTKFGRFLFYLMYMKNSINSQGHSEERDLNFLFSYACYQYTNKCICACAFIYRYNFICVAVCPYTCHKMCSL